jgi:DNA-binding NarL/FixJ family response regulator
MTYTTEKQPWILDRNDFIHGFKRLTARELEILRFMALGYSNRRIAGNLSISEQNAKNHSSAILKKLGVINRTQAVVKSMEYGMIP